MFEKYLETCDDFGKKYYSKEIEKFTDEKKIQLLDLIKKMEQSGCTSPMSYAFSEVDEGIPQFARYLVLRQLFEIADDIQGVYDNAVDYCDCSEGSTDDFEEMHKQIIQIVGKEKLEKYLKIYNKGLVSNFISLLDEGTTCNIDTGFDWALVMTDSEGEIKGDKTICGLHEDFYDFKK